MAPPKKSKSFLNNARKNGADQHRQGINGERVNSVVEPHTTKQYGYAYAYWESYCVETGKDPIRSAHELSSLKDFAHHLAWGIEGRHDNEIAGQNSVHGIWKRFTAGFNRDNDIAIEERLMNSVRNYLRVTVFPERGNPEVKRPRNHARKNHFIHLGRQLWENDWHEYTKPIMRVSIWAQMLLYVFSSARLCEYLEGASRANSGRGLYCKDIRLGVFRNELGEPELAAQTTKDAKGMTKRPNKRPKHEIYEGLSTKPRPLLLNPMIPILAMLVACGRLRDCNTVDEILAIPAPPEDELYTLEWKAPECPLFEGLDGLIQKAATLARILRELGKRAGYYVTPTMHDFRAEGLYLIDKIYSSTQRMVHAGQQVDSTHRQHYAPNNGTDGQAAYTGNTVRSHVADLFRGLSLTRNPDLWQTLPAEKRYELENRGDYIEIENALQTLKGSRNGHLRPPLYNQRRKLIDSELRICQKSQTRRPLFHEVDETYFMGSHRSRFSRARRMMPVRQRLAENIFQEATLRSDLGRQVLADMIALCKQEHEIEVRPGLEPDKCHCIVSKDESSDNRADVKTYRSQSAAQMWKHIYQCHKKHLKERHAFVEFCFRCDRWFTVEDMWEQHCQSHLDEPSGLSVQCDPLIYEGTLVEPGRCPFHQRDSDLAPSKRLYQFTNRIPWKDHINACLVTWTKRQLERPGSRGRVSCPDWHSKCISSSFLPLELCFHLEDIHCMDIGREIKSCLADTETSELELNPPKRRRTKANRTRSMTSSPSYVFVDQTNLVSKAAHYQPSQCSAGTKKRKASCQESIQGGILPDQIYHSDGDEYSSLDGEDCSSRLTGSASPWATGTVSNDQTSVSSHQSCLLGDNNNLELPEMEGEMSPLLCNPPSPSLTEDFYSLIDPELFDWTADSPSMGQSSNNR